jgi:PKD repeat protein
VLQAQSQEPSFDTAYVEANVFPYARLLDSLVHVNDSCTQTVFYMTWGRKNGDASNCAAYPPVCTYSGMQAQLKGRYLPMAYDNHAMTAPVGAAWQTCIAGNPAFDLYMSDESHPSAYGTYLAACTFYATIFRQSPVGLNYYGGLTAAEAGLLQNIASSTVLDSMQVWNTEVYYPVAAFNASITGVNTVTCNSTSADAVSWSWDDGSGNGFVNGNSTAVFTYGSAPPYTICLAVSNGCRTDTICQVIQQTGIPGPGGAAPFSVYPIPATNELNLVNENETRFEYRILGVDGKVILSGLSAGRRTTIDTSMLCPGIYVLEAESSSGRSQVKFTVSGE